MKRALVISGGGSKGAYAAGVVNKLLKTEKKLKFNVFVGTSTGALMAPFLALNKIDVLNDIYKNTITSQVIKQKPSTSFLNQSSIYSTAPLKKLIDKHLSDQECESLLRSRSKEIYILTVCLQTRKLTIFTNKKLTHTKTDIYDIIKLKSAAHLKKAMLASANQPIFMPPIPVNNKILTTSIKNHQYIDGGLLEYAGIEMAMDTQSDEIFTIYLSSTQSKPDTKKYSKIFQMLGPTIGILTGNVGFNDLRIPKNHNKALAYIQDVKNKLSASGVSQAVIDSAFDSTHSNNKFDVRKPYVIHLIRPSEVLKAGTNGLEFVPKQMRVMFDIGEKDANVFLNGLAANQKTWVQGNA